MAYDIQLVERVRKYLSQFSKLKVEEKKMFRGLAFIVNGKMCLNVSGENLMCRFDPQLTGSLSAKSGFLPMVMKGKILQGYCYVQPHGLQQKEDFEYWINLCLRFNNHAKASKKSSHT